MNTRKALAAATVAASAWGFGAGVASAQSSLSVGGVVDIAVGTVNGVTSQLPVEVPQVAVPQVAVPQLPAVPTAVPSLPALPAVPALLVPGTALPSLPNVPMPAAPALPSLPAAPNVAAVVGMHGLSITLNLSSIGFGIQHIAVPVDDAGFMAASAGFVELPDVSIVTDTLAVAQHELGTVVADVMMQVQDWTERIVNGI